MSEAYYYILDLLEGTYTLRILEGAVDLLLTIGPYLVISIIIGVAATRYFRSKKPAFSTRSELFTILSAALIGVVSPLPTYAAIPVDMRKGGAVPWSTGCQVTRHASAWPVHHRDRMRLAGSSRTQTRC